MFILGDIGGTRTRLASAENDGNISEPVRYDTPKTYREGISKLIQEIKNLVGEATIEAISLGVAGSLSRDNTKVYKAPNLPDWDKKPLRENLSDAIGVPVLLENDTALVGLGEATSGAGKDYEIVAYHTVSTGVGGARIVDKKLDEHAYGFEPGHQIIVDPRSKPVDGDSLQCRSCGLFGHLEGFIGGASLQARYGKIPSEIQEEHVWEDAARYLAYGLNNTLMYWSPDVIVLGGGLILHDAIKIDRVKVYLEEICTMFPSLPPIVKSELGDIGGLHGALQYARRKMTN